MAQPDNDFSKVKGSEAERSERKKIRNRLSQRAFRRRRAEQLRDLQSRADASQQPDGERILVLEQENRRLRAHITQLQSRIEGIQENLAQMLKSSSSVLESHRVNEDGQSPTEEVVEAQSPEVSTSADQIATGNISWPPTLPPTDPPNLDPCFPLFPLSGIDSLFANDTLISSNVASSNFTEQPAPPDATRALQICHMPDVWEFEYQMGSQPYTDAMDSSPVSRAVAGIGCVESNSPFSDHITLLKRLLKTKFKQPQSMGSRFSQILYHSVSSVLALFNSMTRPDVMNWYAKTRFLHIVELTAWQTFPSVTTFSRLNERYKPTQVQICRHNQYPCVVDWIPFASVRDRVIQLHAANPCIDQLFCDAVSAYVVEATMSELVMGAPRIKIYVRITDLVATMSLEQSQDVSRIEIEADNPHLPAPDSQTLFSSPGYARLVFKHLQMDGGAQKYKLDPLFFSKYPELCDPSDDVLATGVPLRPEKQTTLTSPRHLDPMMMITYSSFINFSLDAANAFL